MDRANWRRRAQAAKKTLDVCRCLQIVVGLIIIALSTTLSVRWDKLTDRCGESTSKECFKMKDGLGGVQFSIAPGAFALLDVLIFATDEFWYTLPGWFVYGSAQFCGGLALGGGCTLAAMINGWNCEKGDLAGERLCHVFYADLAFQYVLVILAWGGLFAWCYVQKHYRPDVFSRMS